MLSEFRCRAVTRCGGHRSLQNVIFKDIVEERDKAERKEWPPKIITIKLNVPVYSQLSY